MNEGYQITRRPDATFYHGGVVGLVDFVLPAGQVNASEGDDWYLSDEPFCFITTDIVQAWHNALFCEAERGAGAVYRVAPVGRLWLDICGNWLQLRMQTGTHLGVSEHPRMGAISVQGRPERIR